MTAPLDPLPLLARVIEAMAGTPRDQQRQMARRVGDVADEGGVLLVQAGTGTGKSLGYVVPAVEAVQARGAKVVIATATLALQRQLLAKDVPVVVAAADSPISVSVLKGRGNYLCLARVAGSSAAAAPEPGLDLDIATAGSRLEQQAVRLRAWAQDTATGDRDDCPDDIDDRVWRSLSATGRECVGASRCDFGEDCFAEAARATAMAADIIVTNHALLALDALDDTPVIPEHEILIVDEAHEFTSRATAAATDELTVRSAERALTGARSLLSDQTLDRMSDAIGDLDTALREVGEQQRPLPVTFVEPLAALRDAAHLAESEIPSGDDVAAADRHRAQTGLAEVAAVAGRLLSAAAGDVTWVSAGGPTPAALRVAPLSVADQVGRYLADRHTTVLTSATLTLGGSFDALARDLGLPRDGWECLDVGSPFDYARQAILYVAADLPRPGRGGPDPAVIDRIRALIEAAGGRSMVLLSSWRAVDTIAADLIERPLGSGVGQVFVQRRGEPVARLVERFAADESSVLVGTMSLFQGVDVPGPSCTCVIVDRLPFPRPDEPVLAARAERVAAAGGNGFTAVAVPRAALLLAQGAGRLIRTTEDRGVVAVLDSRLVTAGYGDYLRRSLPPLWLSTNTDLVMGALTRLRDGLTSDAAR